MKRVRGTRNLFAGWCLLAAVSAALPGCAQRGADAPAEPAAALPADFPLYPGAELVEVSQTGPSHSARMLSAEGPAQVASAYVQLLVAQGWRQPEVQEMQGEWAVSLRKGRRSAMLVVSGAGSGSAIDVLLTRRPKRHERQATPPGPAGDIP